VTPAPPFSLRPALPEDVAAIAAIYAQHVATGTASFELAPPALDEMARRYAQLVASGYPYFVAHDANERVVGYAYASAYRPRPAYRHTVQDSVYVAADAARRGVGGRLLAALIDACAARGDRQMIAIIGGSDNEASIALHARLGFVVAGRLVAVGWKHGRWIDSVMMQRPLGEAALAPPRDPETEGYR
jgi:phosphinothricin acetyltransferase